jgi:hypothetical protein
MIDPAEKAEVLSRLERLHELLAALDKVTGDTTERRKLRERMQRELDAAKTTVRTFTTHDRE